MTLFFSIHGKHESNQTAISIVLLVIKFIFKPVLLIATSGQKQFKFWYFLWYGAGKRQMSLFSVNEWLKWIIGWHCCSDCLCFCCCRFGSGRCSRHWNRWHPEQTKGQGLGQLKDYLLFLGKPTISVVYYFFQIYN